MTMIQRGWFVVHRIRLITALLVGALLPGCSGIAEGVTEAVLKQETKDTRICHVEGPPSDGLEVFMRAQEKERSKGPSSRGLKVLMVHGIGAPLPGYSGRFTEHLMRELGLDIRSEKIKEVALRDPTISEDPLGGLRISRYMNKERTRELLFYELTWSKIIEEEKKIIAFDDSTEHTFRRASINAAFKRFFNSKVPDSLIFLGEPNVPILSSVRQSICWMTLADWDAYPDFVDKSCDLTDGGRIRQLQEDDYVVVTHSLGSQIVLDTLQYFGNLSATQDEPRFVALRKALRKLNLRIYMFANQLPLLEMGQKRAAVRHQIRSYCRPEGERFQQRMLSELPIYAFSDPNDILSYSVPQKFADEYLDSRLCPRITNVTINVAKPKSLFGFGEFADPGEAHTGYDHDERIIALMVHGIGHDKTAQIVKERCTWLQTTEN